MADARQVPDPWKIQRDKEMAELAGLAVRTRSMFPLDSRVRRAFSRSDGDEGSDCDIGWRAGLWGSVVHCFSNRRVALVQEGWRAKDAVETPRATHNVAQHDFVLSRNMSRPPLFHELAEGRRVGGTKLPPMAFVEVHELLSPEELQEARRLQLSQKVGAKAGAGSTGLMFQFSTPPLADLWGGLSCPLPGPPPAARPRQVDKEGSSGGESDEESEDKAEEAPAVSDEQQQLQDIEEALDILADLPVPDSSFYDDNTAHKVSTGVNDTADAGGLHEGLTQLDEPKPVRQSREDFLANDAGPDGVGGIVHSTSTAMGTEDTNTATEVGKIELEKGAGEEKEREMEKGKNAEVVKVEKVEEKDAGKVEMAEVEKEKKIEVEKGVAPEIEEGKNAEGVEMEKVEVGKVEMAEVEKEKKIEVEKGMAPEMEKGKNTQVKKVEKREVEKMEVKVGKAEVEMEKAMGDEEEVASRGKRGCGGGAGEGGRDVKCADKVENAKGGGLPHPPGAQSHTDEFQVHSSRGHRGEGQGRPEERGLREEVLHRVEEAKKSEDDRVAGVHKDGEPLDTRRDKNVEGGGMAGESNGGELEAIIDELTGHLGNIEETKKDGSRETVCPPRVPKRKRQPLREQPPPRTPRRPPPRSLSDDSSESSSSSSSSSTSSSSSSSSSESTQRSPMSSIPSPSLADMSETCTTDEDLPGDAMLKGDSTERCAVDGLVHRIEGVFREHNVGKWMDVPRPASTMCERARWCRRKGRSLRPAMQVYLLKGVQEARAVRQRSREGYEATLCESFVTVTVGRGESAHTVCRRLAKMAEGNGPKRIAVWKRVRCGKCAACRWRRMIRGMAIENVRNPDRLIGRLRCDLPSAAKQQPDEAKHEVQKPRLKRAPPREGRCARDIPQQREEEKEPPHERIDGRPGKESCKREGEGEGEVGVAKKFKVQQGDGSRREVEGVKPIAVEEVKPVAVEGVKPIVVEGAKPIAVEGVKPVAVEGVKPIAVEGVKPIAVEGEEQQVEVKGGQPQEGGKGMSQEGEGKCQGSYSRSTEQEVEGMSPISPCNASDGGPASPVTGSAMKRPLQEVPGGGGGGGGGGVTPRKRVRFTLNAPSDMEGEGQSMRCWVKQEVDYIGHCCSERVDPRSPATRQGYLCGLWPSIPNNLLQSALATWGAEGLLRATALLRHEIGPPLHLLRVRVEDTVMAKAVHREAANYAVEGAAERAICLSIEAFALYFRAYEAQRDERGARKWYHLAYSMDQMRLMCKKVAESSADGDRRLQQLLWVMRVMDCFSRLQRVDRCQADLERAVREAVGRKDYRLEVSGDRDSGNAGEDALRALMLLMAARAKETELGISPSPLSCGSPFVVTGSEMVDWARDVAFRDA